MNSPDLNFSSSQSLKFPNNFVWGAGTSSYQVEGSPGTAERPASIWDRFTMESSQVQNKETGLIACEHVKHFSEDVQLMQKMNLGAYRFSISWPRIFPEGIGLKNKEGMGFYDRLVDRLLESNIDPWVTLYHWDLPESLMQKGGWLSDDSQEWFSEYVETIYDFLGDRVNNWVTFNEPNLFVPFGFERGLHAPGMKLGQDRVAVIVHQILRSHMAAKKILDCDAKNSLSTTLSLSPWEPDLNSTDEEAALKLAKSKTFEMPPTNPFKAVSVWYEPMINGRYPEGYLQRFEKYLPGNWQEEIQQLKNSINFCALNIYASAGTIGYDEQENQCELKYAQCQETPKTLFHWPVTPEALYWGSRWMHERYGIPIVITENGMSAHDWIHSDGQVHDYHRIDFMRQYLTYLHKALKEDIPVKGYFHWSLMDNFEWAEGYRQKFGLIHIDRKKLKRTLKESAYWYSKLAQTNIIPAI